MPVWVRVVFLKYLPVLLFMKRPKKTRIKWMMEMPGHLDYHHMHHHQQNMFGHHLQELAPSCVSTHGTLLLNYMIIWFTQKFIILFSR